MKAFEKNESMKIREGEKIIMMREHRGPVRHMLPHERKALLHVEFDDKDWSLLQEVFGDEDTAMAAAEIIHEAPPEIQIVAYQLMNLIKEVD